MMANNFQNLPKASAAQSEVDAQIQAALHRGLALHQKGKFSEAKSIYEDILKSNPRHFDALNLLGAIAVQTRNYHAAVDLIGKAIAVNPSVAAAHNNRGLALKELQRLDEALASYDMALALKPDYADAYYHRGLALKELHRLDEALANYDQALALKPDYAEISWNKSVVLLLSGDLDKGWELYEWRFRTEIGKLWQRNYSQPLWLGAEPLEDKTILLHSEQGLGDTIQFCRYAVLVAGLGAKVLLEVQPPLQQLLAGLEGVSQVIIGGEPLPLFDYYCPLLSLPLVFRTTIDTIPADNPYIWPEPGKVAYWRAKLGVSNKPRVGLVWNGGFRPDRPELWKVNDRRNIPLDLISLINSPEFDFFSLQKGEPAESEPLRRKQEVWPESNFFNFAHELEDFSDTAALIENLDLIISVDTSTAHLAAAMGKPVWLLNRFDTCWRWLLDQDDSPWYPTVRIYRQPRMGDWESVLIKVKTDLSKIAHM